MHIHSSRQLVLGRGHPVQLDWVWAAMHAGHGSWRRCSVVLIQVCIQNVQAGLNSSGKQCSTADHQPELGGSSWSGAAMSLTTAI